MDISTNTFDLKLSSVVIVMMPKHMNFKTCQTNKLYHWWICRV